MNDEIENNVDNLAELERLYLQFPLQFEQHLNASLVKTPVRAQRQIIKTFVSTAWP